MGRKTLRSGGNEIVDAEQLFRQSVEQGQPDFRYVALAIGNCPVKPPTWAVLACIAEKERTEPVAARESRELDAVLDELVRVFDHEGQERHGIPEELLGPPFSLNAAIRKACERVGRNPEGSDDEWLYKAVSRAWAQEQETSLVPSTLELMDWKITHRIRRILYHDMGEEFGYPTDPIKYVWVAENLGED